MACYWLAPSGENLPTQRTTPQVWRTSRGHYRGMLSAAWPADIYSRIKKAYCWLAPSSENLRLVVGQGGRWTGGGGEGGVVLLAVGDAVGQSTFCHLNPMSI